MLQSKEKKQVTWLFAFKKLLGGIGSKGMFGLNAAILVGALCTPFIFSFQYFQHAEIVSGPIPPDVPVIRATGYLIRKIEKHGLKEVPYFDFVTDDKKIYRVGEETAFRGAYEFSVSSPPKKIYAEGFLLNHENGLFFFTLVRLPDGRTLVTSEQAMNDLKKTRDYKNYLGFIYVVIFLWAVSIFNIYKLKRKLSTEV